MCSSIPGKGRRSRRSGALRACVPAAPVPLPAALSSPTYNSAESDAARVASRENDARSDRILLLVQTQHLFDHASGTRLDWPCPPDGPPTVIAMLPIAPMQAPHLPVAHAQNLGRLPPCIFLAIARK